VSAGAHIELPAPAWSRGKRLLETFKRRRTIREVSEKTLPMQVLANLLWAANGVNRQHGPFGLTGRTAASASNSQEIDVYVALPKATYRYDPLMHALLPVVSGDLRPLAISRGQSPLGSTAPVRLIYVVDVDRLINTAGFPEPGLKDPDVQRSYYYVDTGLIAANVYLFAASTGLAAWFHNCDKTALSKKLDLRANQRVLFAQTVGYAVQEKGR
jgi:nitroreductase